MLISNNSFVNKQNKFDYVEHQTWKLFQIMQIR